MPNLWITYEGLQSPPPACAEEPTQAKAKAKKAQDSCFLTIPLLEQEDSKAAPHRIRFDRQDDHFVLSNSNSPEEVTWVGRHQNLDQILDILKLTEDRIRSNGYVSDPQEHSFQLMVAQYVVTGKVRFPGKSYAPEGFNESTAKVHLANFLLGSFAISGKEAIRSVGGALSVFRGGSSLSKEARQRIEWISSILDLLPQYESFRRHFAEEQDVSNFDQLPLVKRGFVADILNYCRKALIYHWMNLPLPYDKDILNAFMAFQALNPKKDEAKMAQEFCSRLSLAFSELPGKHGSQANALSECRVVLRWIALDDEKAIKQSLEGLMLSEVGLQKLQSTVAEASEESRMSVPWLDRRGRMQAVLGALTRHLQVLPNSNADLPPNLSLDFKPLIMDLTLLTDAHPVQRREYLLAALAVFKSLFGNSENPEPARVFYQGEFHELSWRLPEEGRREIREFSERLERELRVSQRRSDIWLPVLEGATCALGAVGLGLSEGLPSIRNSQNLHLGIGTPSAALLGAGCAALVGHFLLPKMAKVRNRYLWEGVTAGVGGVLSAGFYLLGTLLSQGDGSTVKFPTDIYGPLKFQEQPKSIYQKTQFGITF